MDKIYLIKGAKIVNDGKVFEAHVLVKNGKIDQVITDGFVPAVEAEVIEAHGKYLIPGVIDDQVHFREPGLIHKADIFTESRAAVAGGVTSYMEMPNTNPQTLTQELLEKKYQLAATKSMANYSFLMGVSNNNLDEVFKTDKTKVAGLKVFMGSSTGDMLVDDKQVLEELFKNAGMIIAAHCEDEATIQRNTQIYRQKYGEDVPISCHPEIRSAEACYRSSATAVELAHKFGAKLHLFHLSTARELELLDNSIPLEQKNVTGEICVHHLWFNNTDYEKFGTRIKWNPAVKYKEDQQALFEALLNDKLDVIATDHAPHTLEEKNNTYFKAPSGGPLVQHSLQAMLDFYHQGKISLERIVEKMCHAPARLFQIEKRGYIRPGYWADLVLVDLDKPVLVHKPNIYYKCGWSPFEGHTFGSSVTHTFVNGQLAFHNGVFNEAVRGDRLLFNR
ncbi:MAG: dihydroorotase [Bacteroidales bacterium]|nr:dihydroorotase [Bacteroidales bacterium]